MNDLALSAMARRTIAMAELRERAEAGQAMAEYALIIALIAVMAITALVGFRRQLQATFTSIVSAMANGQ